MAADDIIDLGGFWNLRGSFRIGGALDIGTHCSLVRRAGGGYLLLDACSLGPAAGRLVDDETNGGERLEAILHLHPFHTVFARKIHERYRRRSSTAPRATTAA